MYETADMMHANTRQVVAGIIKEMRAEVPEWTRDGIRAGGRRATPAARKPAAPAAPAVKKTPAPAARTSTAPRKKPVRASEISASLRETIRKCEVDIDRFKRKIDQLDGDIRHMTAMFVPQNSKLMMQKKQERDELRQKIEKLQGIRDRCKKMK
jgi:hypothetical protein